MKQALPLRFLVSRHQVEDGPPGAPIHLSVYAAGSPKAKRRTLCGIPTPDLRTLAPFDIGDRRENLYARGCEICLDRLAF